jgi:hypothetical protein
MSGAKERFDMTFLTGRSVYRENISSADSAPDAVAPLIRLDKDADQLIQNAPAPATLGPSGRAYNGHLELYVELTLSGSPVWEIYDGIVTEGDPANIGVFVWDDDAHDPTPASSGRWVLAEARSITCSSLIILRNIPAGAYKVLVLALPTGASIPRILEQHTE